MYQYSLVVLGGTFDHFHKGHELFLEFILERSRNMLLGLTTDKFAHQKNLRNSIEPYNTRKQTLEAFFNTHQAGDRVQILPIDNVFIPKVWENLHIEAIIVTQESKKGAEFINKDRNNRNLPKLPIVVFPLVQGEGGLHISSYAVRSGQMTRDGKLYIKKEWLEKGLILPAHLRPKLAEPFGTLITNFSEWIRSSEVPQKEIIVTVGDWVTKSFNENNIEQWCSVIDWHVQRKRSFNTLLELGFTKEISTYKISNASGSITPALFKAVQSISDNHSSSRVLLEVQGEEDLAVLPFLLILPLGYVIFYGQPNVGIVRIDVAEGSKSKAQTIANSFVFPPN